MHQEQDGMWQEKQRASSLWYNPCISQSAYRTYCHKAISQGACTWRTSIIYHEHYYKERIYGIVIQWFDLLLLLLKFGIWIILLCQCISLAFCWCQLFWASLSTNWTWLCWYKKKTAEDRLDYLFFLVQYFTCSSLKRFLEKSEQSQPLQCSFKCMLKNVQGERSFLWQWSQQVSCNQPLSEGRLSLSVPLKRQNESKIYLAKHQATLGEQQTGIQILWTLKTKQLEVLREKWHSSLTFLFWDLMI